jgi:arylamine N-acetyltransferase
MPRHRVLVVNVQGKRYLVDVGVGGLAPRWPLLMVPGMEQEQNGEIYRLSCDPILGNVIEEFRHGTWSSYISFTDNPAYPVDFIATNYWCQHAQESIFNKEPMATLRTADGRVTMSGREVKVFSPQGVRVIPMGPEEIGEMARICFGVNLNLSAATGKDCHAQIDHH